VFATIISCVSLAISAVIAWLTFFQRGRIKMTQPTVVFFGPDGVDGRPKVFLRTLLFSTARRGQIVESMYIRLRRMETTQNFSIWVYGDKTTALVRGSGLFVGYEGVGTNHHFLLDENTKGYEFLAGEYQFGAQTQNSTTLT
jgi:hypothetical protein